MPIYDYKLDSINAKLPDLFENRMPIHIQQTLKISDTFSYNIKAKDTLTYPYYDTSTTTNTLLPLKSKAFSSLINTLSASQFILFENSSNFLSTDYTDNFNNISTTTTNKSHICYAFNTNTITELIGEVPKRYQHYIFEISGNLSLSKSKSCRRYVYGFITDLLFGKEGNDPIHQDVCVMKIKELENNSYLNLSNRIQTISQDNIHIQSIKLINPSPITEISIINYGNSYYNSESELPISLDTTYRNDTLQKVYSYINDSGATITSPNTATSSGEVYIYANSINLLNDIFSNSGYLGGNIPVPTNTFNILAEEATSDTYDTNNIDRKTKTIAIDTSTNYTSYTQNVIYAFLTSDLNYLPKYGDYIFIYSTDDDFSSIIKKTNSYIISSFINQEITTNTDTTTTYIKLDQRLIENPTRDISNGSKVIYSFQIYPNIINSQVEAETQVFTNSSINSNKVQVIFDTNNLNNSFGIVNENSIDTITTNISYTANQIIFGFLKSDFLEIPNIGDSIKIQVSGNQSLSNSTNLLSINTKITGIGVNGLKNNTNTDNIYLKFDNLLLKSPLTGTITSSSDFRIVSIVIMNYTIDLANSGNNFLFNDRLLITQDSNTSASLLVTGTQSVKRYIDFGLNNIPQKIKIFGELINKKNTNDIEIIAEFSNNSYNFFGKQAIYFISGTNKFDQIIDISTRYIRFKVINNTLEDINIKIGYSYNN